MTTATPPVAADSQYPVRLEVDYPERLSRGLIFVKWLLAIPHYIVLVFLQWGMLAATFIAWWAILFTGRHPRSLFDFVVEVQQWALRVNGYAGLLVTDEYPPFSLGRTSTGTAIAMIVLGVFGFIAFLVVYTVIVVAAVTSQYDPATMPR